MKCNNCGKANPASMTVCSECGNKLTKLCPFCNEPVFANAEFCLNCGKDITDTVEVACNDNDIQSMEEEEATVEIFEVDCPYCGATICFEGDIDMEAIPCPECGEVFACIVEEDD